MEFLRADAGGDLENLALDEAVIRLVGGLAR